MKVKSLKLGKLLTFLAISITFFACSDDGNDTPKPQNESSKGLYVLCEGTFQHNNSALDFFSFEDSTTTKNLFETVNSLGLGETANDAIKIGDELWIAVNGSAMVAVVDSKDGKLKNTIPVLDENGVNRQPRHLIHHNNFVYLTCFDGNVVKINAKTKEIVGVLATGGRNPEGIAIAGQKIYVANSGGLDYPNYDNTVSVINSQTFEVEKMIQVMQNPQFVKSYNDRVYVVSTGDYSGTYRLTVLENGGKVDSIDVNITDFAFNNGYLYYVYKPWGNGAATLNKISVNNLHSAPKEFINAPDGLVTPYRICIIDGIIYVTDVKNFTVSGEVFAFDENNGLLYSFPTSIGPNNVIKK